MINLKRKIDRMEEYGNSNIMKEYKTLCFEKTINKKMMYYDYTFPIDEVCKYVHELNSLRCSEIVENILSSSESEYITSADIFQFSNFNDCTLKICSTLKANENPGVKALDMGKLLLDDGKSRKEGAYTKYGENHLKAATLLGLMWKYYDTYYLTCLGYVYDTLNELEQNRLLTRLILRNNLVKRIIRATYKGNLNMRQFCYMLSDSTYVRRRSNIKSILLYLKNSDEYDFSTMFDKIIW